MVADGEGAALGVEEQVEAFAGWWLRERLPVPASRVVDSAEVIGPVAVAASVGGAELWPHDLVTDGSARSR